MGPDASGSAPTVSAVVTTQSVGGTCVGAICTVSGAASTVVTCGVQNDGSYTLNLYENGVLVASNSNGVNTGGGTFVKTFTGYSATGGSPYINPNLTYRADVVRNTDSVVVSSKTGAAYLDTFGTCGGPP
jgi:hypothetical protein